MEQPFDLSGSYSEPAWSSRTKVPTILIVEDDPDVREMLSTLLDLAGFNCVACDTAEAGLAALRHHHIDLILTDYALPEHTGVWLLEHAEKEGLIEDTPVMFLTAQPHPAGTSTYEVVQKPFDPDDLMDRVKRHTGASRRRRRSDNAAPSPHAGNGEAGHSGGGCPEPVELILYVTSPSVRSAATISNIEKTLARFHSSRVKLTVCDLSMQPGARAGHNVALTPTLLQTSPSPRTCILGHITNPELVLELLSECELREG